MDAEVIPNTQSDAAVVPTASKRVLISWDDAEGLQRIVATLGKIGVEVVVADSGTQVVEKLQETEPDAIVLALGAQDIPAAQVVKEARKRPKFASLPIYVCTACPSLRAWEKVRAANQGPTKLFNTLSSSLDAILGEVTADLMAGPTAGSFERPPGPAAVAKTPPEISPSVSAAEEAPNKVSPMPFASKARSLFQRRSEENSPDPSVVAAAVSSEPAAPVLKMAANGEGAAPQSADENAGAQGQIENLGDNASGAGEARSTRPKLAVLVIGQDGKIRFAYPSAILMFQRERQDMVGQKIQFLVEGGIDPDLEKFIQAPEAAGPANARRSAQVTARGSERAFPALLTLARNAEESGHCWTAVFKDLSTEAGVSSQVPSRPKSALKLGQASAAVEQNQSGPDFQEQFDAMSAEVAKFPEVLKQCEEAQAALQQEATRRSQLQEEMAGLRQMCDDLLGQLGSDAAPADSPQANEELERIRAELEKQMAESARRDEEFRNLAAEKASLENDLGRMRENQSASQPEPADPGKRAKEGVAALARVTAELERERAERHRLETRASALTAQLQDLHEQTKQHLQSERLAQENVSRLEELLRARAEAVTRLDAELEKQIKERQVLEDQLRTTQDLSVQLRNNLASFEAAKKAFKRSQEELETRLQRAESALQEKEGKSQEDLAERKRLEEKLAAAERVLHDQSQSASELTKQVSKLQCALEIEQAEKKCLESDAVQSRYASLDSARLSMTMVNHFRSQIRPPADQVLQSTRRLLEVPLKDEEKRLVESLLENVLLLQTKLDESSELNEEAPPTQFSEPARSAA
jgi:CheY-like chemotaxis protein